MVYSYIGSVRIISTPFQSLCKEDRPWAYNTYYMIEKHQQQGKKLILISHYRPTRGIKKKPWGFELMSA